MGDSDSDDDIIEEQIFELLNDILLTTDFESLEKNINNNSSTILKNKLMKIIDFLGEKPNFKKLTTFEINNDKEYNNVLKQYQNELKNILFGFKNFDIVEIAQYINNAILRLNVLLNYKKNRQ